MNLKSKVCENETECLNPAYFPCHHCSKHLCLGHVMEHNGRNLVRASELSIELDNLTESLSQFNTSESFKNARNNLDHWKSQMLGHIENTYVVQSNEIDRLEKELNHRLDIFTENLQLKMSDLKIQLAKLRDVKEISQQVICSGSLTYSNNIFI
jgi:exonuclease VII large subunit